MVIPSLPALEGCRESLAELSEYAVEIRYPGDWFEPLRSEAEKAFAVAEQVVNMAREYMADKMQK